MFENSVDFSIRFLVAVVYLGDRSLDEIVHVC